MGKRFIRDPADGVILARRSPVLMNSGRAGASLADAIKVVDFVLPYGRVLHDYLA